MIGRNLNTNPRGTLEYSVLGWKLNLSDDQTSVRAVEFIDLPSESSPDQLVTGLVDDAGKAHRQQVESVCGLDRKLNLRSGDARRATLHRHKGKPVDLTYTNH